MPISNIISAILSKIRNLKLKTDILFKKIYLLQEITERMQPVDNNIVGKVIGDYVIDKFVAKGGFGLIHQCYNVNDKDKKPFIVKMISKKSAELAGPNSAYYQGLLDTEIDLMTRLNHPNLIYLVDHLESSNFVYLVLPFCADGDMTAYMKRKGPGWYFPEEEAVYYLKQISAGFSELFTRGIMHRDFKLENVFMDNGKCVIGDLGAAKELKYADAKCRTTIGGYTYSAPEVLKGELDSYGNQYDSKCDIWSIGIAYWYLLYGVQPFQGGDISILEKVELESGENLKFPSKPKISDSSKDILKKMLQFDPRERIDWQDLFEHVIFTKETFVEDCLQSGIQSGIESEPKRKDTMSDITPNMFLEVADMFEKGKDLAKSQSKAISPPPLSNDAQRSRSDTKSKRIDDDVYASNLSDIRKEASKKEEFDSYHARFQFEFDEINFLYLTVSSLRSLSKILPSHGDHQMMTDILCAILCIKTHLHCYKNQRALVAKRNYYQLDFFEDWLESQDQRLSKLITEYNFLFENVD